MPDIQDLNIPDDILPAFAYLTSDDYSYTNMVLTDTYQHMEVYPIRQFTFKRFHGVVFDVTRPYSGPTFRVILTAPNSELEFIITLSDSQCEVQGSWVGGDGTYGTRNDATAGNYRYLRIIRTRLVIEGFTAANDYLFVQVSKDALYWQAVAQSGDMANPDALDDDGWSVYFEFGGYITLGPIYGTDVTPVAPTTDYDFKLRTPSGWQSVATIDNPLNLRMPDGSWAILNNREQTPGPKLYVRQGSDWLFVAGAGNDPNWRLHTVATHYMVPDPSTPGAFIPPGPLGGLNDTTYQEYYLKSTTDETSQLSNLSYNGGYIFNASLVSASSGYLGYDSELARDLQRDYGPPTSYYAKEDHTQRFALLDLANYTAWLNNYFPQKDFYGGIYKPLNTMKLKRIQIVGNLAVYFEYNYYYDHFGGRIMPSDVAEDYSRPANVQLVRDVSWSLYAQPNASGDSIAASADSVDAPFNPRYPAKSGPVGDLVVRQQGIQGPPGYWRDPGNNGHTAYRPFAVTIEDPGDAVKLTLTADLPDRSTADGLIATVGLGLVAVKLLFAVDGHDAPAGTLKPSRGLGVHTGVSFEDTFNTGDYL